MPDVLRGRVPVSSSTASSMISAEYLYDFVGNRVDYEHSILLMHGENLSGSKNHGAGPP